MKTYKIIGFSVDKEIQRSESDEWGGLMQTIKKHITAVSDTQIKKIEKNLQSEIKMVQKDNEEFRAIT